MNIREDSPAKKCGLKADDVILGIKDGMDFKTQMDYNKFQKTTKPGDRYKFRIDRKGQVLIKTIKMY